MVGRFFGMLLWSAKCPRPPDRIGEHLMNGDLENHLQHRSFRLVQWSNIVFLLRRTSQDSNLVRKFYLAYSSDMYCSRRGILERRHHGCRHWGAGKSWRVRNSSSKAQCIRNNKRPKKEWTCPWSQLQMEQPNCLEEIMESENPLYGRDQPERSEDLREECQRNSDGTQPAENKRGTWKSANDSWSMEGSQSHWNTLTWQETAHHQSGSARRKGICGPGGSLQTFKPFPDLIFCGLKFAVAWHVYSSQTSRKN